MEAEAEIQPEENGQVDVKLDSEAESLDDLRQMANHSFSVGDYDTALSLYTAAIEKADDIKDKQALIINLCNRAACLTKMERYELAQFDASQALDASQGTSLKAFYRLAKAQIQLKAYGNAVATIDAAIEHIKEMQLELESESPSLPLSKQAPKLQDNQKENENNHDNHNGNGNQNDYDYNHLNRQLNAFKELLIDANKGEAKINLEQQEYLTSIKDVKRGVSIREFNKVQERELGAGNFSEIVICQHKITHERFALKIIEKKRAADLAKRQHPNVYNEIQMERRVLLERLTHHPNIVRMYHAFQDYNSLYYLMDLHQGGEMWNSLRENNFMVGCHRSIAKTYLAELVDALEHIHSHGIVHRDLKPENLLFSNTGHLMVIDFGTAKDMIQTDLNGPEFVGTPDFMAPEAVRGSGSLKEAQELKQQGTIGADHTLDLYDLGAVAFQLHTGMTPYWSPSPYLTFLKIKRGNLVRPLGIADDDAWDFISSLMRLDPAARLGAETFRIAGNLKRTIVKKEGGYQAIRNHPYFVKQSQFAVPTLDTNYQHITPIPSLRDLCIRACAELARLDSLDLDLCDQHPPGDGSSHDMLRLDNRDRRCVMHHLERRKLLKEPTIYRRFFTSPEAYRLDKIRQESRDYVGLTKMTDDQYKFPDPREHDSYAEPKPIDPIQIVQITNPLLIKEINQSCIGSDVRKTHLKLFKKCISTVNRTRPKIVIVAGYVDDTCRKLLARINDSIPVVIADGKNFFSFWTSGIECLALASSSLLRTDEEDVCDNGNDSDVDESHSSNVQMKWLQEELEQNRMAKYNVFAFVDTDPRNLSQLLMKRLARGKVHLLCGLSNGVDGFRTGIRYEANETLDDVSIKSVDSEEEESDDHVMGVVASHENGLRCITVRDREIWEQEFKAVSLS